MATACEPQVAAKGRWQLEPSPEPLHSDEAHELDADDSVRWLEDGRLFVERVSAGERYRTVEQLWVAFEPGKPARVEVSGWNEELSSGARWPRTEFVGLAWVSSEGAGLGRPGGPDLVIDVQWRCTISGSDQPGGRRLHLRSDQLQR